MPAAQTREAIQQLRLLHKLPRDRRLMCSIERMIESYMFLTFFIPYMYIHSKKVDLCKTIFNLFFICMFYKEIYFPLKGECSYAASIGGMQLGGGMEKVKGDAGASPRTPYATIYPHGWRPFVYLEQKHPSFLRNMYYVCSYAASIGVKLTGDSVISSMIRIRKGIPCYPKAACKLSESVLEGVFIGTNFASHFVYKLLRSI